MAEPWHRSLFGRLLLIFLVTLAAYGAVLMTVLVNVTQEHPRTQFSRELFVRLVERVGNPPTPTALAHLAEDFRISLLVTGPDITWRSDNRLPEAKHLIDAVTFDRDFGTIAVDGRPYAVLRAGDRTWFITGFAVPLSDKAKVLIVGGLAMFILLAFLNYRAVRWLFDPIRDVHRAAENIAAGDLGYRLKVTRTDEIGRLTASINAMAERIQTMLEAKRHLLMAISHEIRSPLARARVAVEMVPDERPRERIVAALDDVNRLVGALLDAEALDGQVTGLRRERLDLRAIIREAVRDADDARIETLLPETALVTEIDPLRIHLLVANLLSNALRYGGDGPVTVTLEHGETGPRIVVADCGPGIAAEHLPRLGEPFYRPDGSRSRGTGGHGLGLYLCRQIAEAHGGRLRIDSAIGEGTHVTVDLGRCE